MKFLSSNFENSSQRKILSVSCWLGITEALRTCNFWLAALLWNCRIVIHYQINLTSRSDNSTHRLSHNTQIDNANCKFIYLIYELYYYVAILITRTIRNAYNYCTVVHRHTRTTKRSAFASTFLIFLATSTQLFVLRVRFHSTRPFYV